VDVPDFPLDEHMQFALAGESGSGKTTFLNLMAGILKPDSLLWGSLNSCRWRDVRLMLATSLALLILVVLFFKEMRAIMFSRQDAAAAGIHTTAVWTVFLVLTAGVLTVNFQTVGGLMIYSLVVNPAAAAFQMVSGCGRTMALAMVLGAASGLGGFLISAAADLPSEAAIVTFSSGLVGAAAMLARARRRSWSGRCCR
jgi:manganese/iron transport system permease protein